MQRSVDVLCHADHTINTNINSSVVLDRVYTSSGTLETQSRKETFGPVDVVVRKNETVEFRADHIKLQPGFKVDADALFNATIEPCDQ